MSELTSADDFGKTSMKIVCILTSTFSQRSLQQAALDSVQKTLHLKEVYMYVQCYTKLNTM